METFNLISNGVIELLLNLFLILGAVIIMAFPVIWFSKGVRLIVSLWKSK